MTAIYGDNFGSTGTVSIGGKSCAVLSYNDTFISCATPLGEGSVVPVVVTNAAQQSVCPGSAGWTPDADLAPTACTTSYPPPVITTMTPTHGGVVGGYPLTLTGSSFGTGAYTVVVVGDAVCPIQAMSETEIQCTVAPGLGRAVGVNVTVAGQQSNVLTFSFDAPSFVGVSPMILDALVGGGVNLYGGLNFGGNDEASQALNFNLRVVIGGVPCVPVFHFDDNRLLCTFPANLPVDVRRVVVYVGDRNSTEAMPRDVQLQTMCMAGSFGSFGQRGTPCAAGGVCAGGDALPAALSGYVHAWGVCGVYELVGYAHVWVCCVRW